MVRRMSCMLLVTRKLQKLLRTFRRRREITFLVHSHNTASIDTRAINQDDLIRLVKPLLEGAFLLDQGFFRHVPVWFVLDGLWGLPLL